MKEKLGDFGATHTCEGLLNEGQAKVKASKGLYLDNNIKIYTGYLFNMR